MSATLKITAVERRPMRHGDGCYCAGGEVPLAWFTEGGVRLGQVAVESGMNAREAAALLSREGLSSEFYYRGQGELCSWLQGYAAAKGRSS